MESNYLISIVGEQKIDGETDSVEVVTEGSYVFPNGRYFITYEEYDKENPSEHYTSVVKAEGEKMVTIMRAGGISSRLTLEKDRRHYCHYSVPVGEMMIGIYTSQINSTLSEKGGELFVKYTIDFNASLASENEFHITVKHKNDSADLVL